MNNRLQHFVGYAPSCTSYALLVAILTAMVAGCSAPYRDPYIEHFDSNETRSYAGIMDWVNTGQHPKIIWAHGMCSHDATWIHDRADRLSNYTGASIKSPKALNAMTDGSHLTKVTFAIESNSFDTYFYLWSPLTKILKGELLSDASGTDPRNSNPFTRARLNEQLKVKLMNDCLADAVIYTGSSGNVIRHSAILAVCTILDGKVKSNRCEVPDDELNRPIIVVGESLGSKIIFDAIRHIWSESGEDSTTAQTKLARKITNIRAVFLVANQLPILDLATNDSDFRPSASDDEALTVPPGASAARGESSLDSVLTILQYADEVAGEEAFPPPGAEFFPDMRRQLVAVSDPNDLLSYRLLEMHVKAKDVRLVNVIVSNSPTYLGLVEMPDVAHSGYLSNDSAVRAVIFGANE